MSNRWLITSLCASLLLQNCKPKKSNPLQFFNNKEESHLSGEEIHLENDTILFMPYDFKVVDSFLVFNDNTGDAGYSVVNANNGRLIKKFAFAGIDSSEFNINGLSMTKAAGNQSLFTITQFNPPNKIAQFNWDSLLSNKEYKPTSFYYPNKFGFGSAILLNDSILLGRFNYSTFDNKMFGVVNLSSAKLTTGIEVPGVNDNSNNRRLEDSAYFKWMNKVLEDNFVYRPGSRYEFASFSFQGAVMQIFTVDSTYNLKLEYEKNFYLPSFYILDNGSVKRAKTDPESLNGFASVAATKDNIYALFNGPLLNGDEPNDDSTDIVLVYDWDGNPIKKIMLDRKCSRISIDENKPELLYVLYGGRNGQIAKYRL